MFRLRRRVERTGLACVVLFAVAIAREPLRAQDPAADPKFAAAMLQGDTLFRERKFEEALDAYKTANNIAGKKSARALLSIARAYHGLGAFKSEADSCLEGLKFTGADQALEGALHNQRGLAILDLAQSTENPKIVKDAEAEFRSALVLPNPPVVNWYNLGVSLMRQGRDDVGIAAMRTFVEHAGRAPEVAEAQRIIENPRRARVIYSPEFSFTTMSGEFVSLKDLKGKTLLLDFWGTWCGPCLMATPTLVNLYRKFSKPSSDGTPAAFEMLGISSDARQDEAKLREYVGKNSMLWPQHHDASRAIHRMFDITSFPTYFVIDAEGIIRGRMNGWNPAETGQRIDSAIKTAMKERAPSAPAPLLFVRP